MTCASLSDNIDPRAERSSAKLHAARELRAVRRRRGFSQAELSDLLGVSQSNVSRWENGYEEMPDHLKLFMNKLFAEPKEPLAPLVRQMIARDRRISVFWPEKNKPFVDSRWLHLSPILAAYFDIPKTEAHMALSSRFLVPDWQLAVHTGERRGEWSMIEFECDCMSASALGVRKSCRLRSRQYVIDIVEYSKVTLSISSICGPATGEMPRIHHVVYPDDLARFPQSKGLQQTARVKIETPPSLPAVRSVSHTVFRDAVAKSDAVN